MLISKKLVPLNSFCPSFLKVHHSLIPHRCGLVPGSTCPLKLIPLRQKCLKNNKTIKLLCCVFLVKVIQGLLLKLSFSEVLPPLTQCEMIPIILFLKVDWTRPSFPKMGSNYLGTQRNALSFLRWLGLIASFLTGNSYLSVISQLQTPGGEG